MSEDLAQSEVERMVSNMIRVGKIKELDEKNARVKVETAGLTTDWLPFGTPRAGETREWNPPEKDEQVVLLCPYGDLGQAIVGHSIYQDKFASPGDKKHITKKTYKDGTSISYDREKHEYNVEMHEGGKFNITAGNGTLTLTKDKLTFSIGGTKIEIGSGGINISGKVTCDADVVASGISLVNHTHSDPQGGKVSPPS